MIARPAGSVKKKARRFFWQLRPFYIKINKENFKNYFTRKEKYDKIYFGADFSLN